MDNYKEIMDLMNKNHENLTNEVRDGFKQVNIRFDGMVDKETCQLHRNNINVNQEWSVKKITAISGAVTAILTTSGTVILSIAKAFGLI